MKHLSTNFILFFAFLFWEDSGEMTGKYWVGERGAGSAKDLEAGIELGSLSSCAICRRTNHEAIGADISTHFQFYLSEKY